MAIIMGLTYGKCACRAKFAENVLESRFSVIFRGENQQKPSCRAMFAEREKNQQNFNKK